MRADRLLSILLILQHQGRATAQQLAADLEVSERTIYRDIDALSIAGVPIYGEPGPDGGYALLDNFRTYLTGLTAPEMQALFMLSIPQSLSELGASHSLKSALLKIFASMPSDAGQNEEWVRERFLLDATPWPQSSRTPQLLQTVQEAVRQDRQLLIRFRVGPLGRDIELAVLPYSLVEKAGVWRLVYAVNGQIRVMRAAELTGATLLDDRFERPMGFDLASFWEEWCADHAEERSAYRVTVRAKMEILASLEPWRMLGQPAQAIDEASASVLLDLAFESLEDARAHILGMGGAVEVLGPEALRASIADYAQQTLLIYQEDKHSRSRPLPSMSTG